MRLNNIILLSLISVFLFSCKQDENAIPGFVDEQGAETAARFKAWRGTDNVVLFPIISDVHAHDRDTYRHIGYLAYLDRYFNYDFMVNLGDIGLNLGLSNTSVEHADSVISHTVQQMSKYYGIFLYAPGNHDWDAGAGNFNSEQYLSSIFQKPSQSKAGANLHLKSNRCYGYYDVQGKGTRVIFLNSQSTCTMNGYYYYFGDEQLDWLRRVLESTPADVDIVLLSHYQPHPQGRWGNTPSPETLDSNNKMMDLLAEYQPKRQIVGLFTGDSHVNLLEVDRGVHYYTTQSYGTVDPSVMMEGQRHADFDYHKSLCCDVVAVKPEKNEVKTFRIGAGGAEFDYEFTY